MILSTDDHERKFTAKLRLALPALFSSLLLGLGAAPALGETISATRLTDFQTPQGRVENAQVSPDGSRVVYLASQDQWSVDELYSVPAAGGPAVKLNPPMVSGGDVYDFLITPDSGHVVYRADAEIDEKIELYRVPITGGAAEKMNGPMVPAGDVVQFDVSPSSQHVLYTANQMNFQVTDLYSHTLATGVVAKLSQGLPTHHEVHAFAVSPDSSQVAWLQGDYRFSGQVEPHLHASPIGGGGSVALETTDPVEQFDISLDSSEVFFLRKTGSDGFRRVPIGGGVSSSVLPAGYVVESSFTLTADQSKALFVGDFDGSNDELYVVEVAGGTVDQISVLGSAGSPLLSADESVVVFCGGSGVTNSMKAAPLAGGPPVELDDCNFEERALTPDGSLLVLRRFSDAANRLFTVPTDASTSAQELTPPFASTGGASPGVSTWSLDAPGARAVYVSNQEDDLRKVFSVPVGGGDSTLLSDALVPGGEVLRMHEVDDSVLFSAEQDTRGYFELYEVPVAGGAASKLNGTMFGTGGWTSRFAASPDGSRVVFIANQRAGVGRELWTYGVANGGPALLLNATLLPDVREILSFAIDAAGERVAFRAEMEPDGSEQLYSVPIEGGTAILLSDPADEVGNYGFVGGGATVYYTVETGDGVYDYRRAPATGGVVETFASGVTRAVVSPGRQRLVYQAGDGQGWQTVLIETGPTNQLTPLAADRVAFSPDGARVVFWLDQGFGELYSVSSAGGASIRLHDAGSPCNGSDEFFTITRDSSRVIFFCGGSQYSVPIGGGAVATLTPFPLENITTSSDGSTVFGIRTLGATSRDLVAVPATGGAPTTLANFTVPSEFLGERFRDLEVAPGDEHVFVRVAVETGRENLALWGVPVAGGPALRYNAENTRVDAYDFSDDGSTVFFVEGLLYFDGGFTPARSQLLRMPVGGGAAVSYHPQMPIGGEVEAFEVSGDAVLYTADLEQDNVRDLYRARLSGLFADGFESGDLSAWSSSTP